jgi:hypothetical protein
MTDEAAQQELHHLRAEVQRLRHALELQRVEGQSERRGLFEPDPELPGLGGLWRGERGLGWQLFVQAVVAVNAVLAVAAGIAIVH